MKNQIVKLCKGNPGAMRVLCQLAKIDSRLLDYLEMYNITGSDIWYEYKDICGEDIEKYSEFVNEKYS